MRTDASAFAVKDQAAAKAPRFVVQIEFASISLYISSHADVTDIPATHIDGALSEPSISSQKLNPDQGRAEIGAASFSVVDLNNEFSDNLRALLAAGEGLRDKTCHFYLGYEGLAWSDFVLVGTQIVKSAAYDHGEYKVACNDIQRSARKEIFSGATTTIAATVEAADTTINVAVTTGFSMCKHGTSYSDAASSTVGYIKIKDEVIRYTGTTSTSFTGCTRGVLGTTAARYVADGATPAARREKVSEYIYLEMPGPKLLYALLTGVLYGDSANLPATWHLGISTALIRTADFTGIGVDLWDTTSDAVGVILRFEGLTKVDGKAFAELEILRLLGLFMPVYADGSLGLRRMTRVLEDAAGVVTLDESNSVTVGELEHDMESLHNTFAIQWNWNGKEYSRTTTYIDATSVATHGQSPTLELKFKGLYGGRHTDGLIFKLLDSIRDRYSAPPVRLQVDVLHSLNRLEVGDVVRVKHALLRDYAGAGASIDRAFEIQSVTVNHRTGAVSLQLFGSTSSAAIESPTTATTALPDAFYTAAGTNLTGVMTIAGGVVSGGPYTLAGTTDLTAAGSVWYYSGDLTIPAGVTVNVSGNVQLRIKGYLTVNGTITGIGGGWAGVADNATSTPIIAGNPGYVGNSRGTDGLTRYNITWEKSKLATKAPLPTIGKNPSFPYLSLEVVGNALKGLPTDLRGTGGGPGGKVVHDVGTFYKGGGTGGAGGAGLCTISRGFGLGADAVINLTGAATTAQSPYTQTEHDGMRTKNIDLYPGTPGAGGPGSFLLLIDGGLLSVPDLSGRFRALCGACPYPTAVKTFMAGAAIESHQNADRPYGGYQDPSVISGLDLSFSALRIQYIPAPETAVADTQTLAPVESLSITQGSSGCVVIFTPAVGTPIGTVFELWQYSSATPFSSASKIMEGPATAFFLPLNSTTAVYIWIRARFKTSAGLVIYSTTTPASSGQIAQAAAVAGTYATVTLTTLSASAASSSITTASTTASLVGGTGTTYAWARTSGSTSIAVNSASAATTTFSATGVGTGATVSAVFRCTVNSTYTVDVAVDCTNSTSSLSANATPSPVTKTDSGATVTTASCTASATGGAGGYSYAWTKVSGDAITITSASAAATTFVGSTMTAGETRNATMRCTVTDSAAATSTIDVSVTVTRSNMSVDIAPTSLSKVGSTHALTTASCTATASGGVATYSYAWAYVSGYDLMACNSPASATTTFTTGLLSGESVSTIWEVTATDSSGTPLTATDTITVYIERT